MPWRSFILNFPLEMTSNGLVASMRTSLEGGPGSIPSGGFIRRCAFSVVMQNRVATEVEVVPSGWEYR